MKGLSVLLTLILLLLANQLATELRRAGVLPEAREQSPKSPATLMAESAKLPQLQH